MGTGDDSADMVMKTVKLEPDLVRCTTQLEEKHEAELVHNQNSESHAGRLGSEENRGSNVASTGQSCNSVLDQVHSPLDDSCLSSAPTIGSAPICRQFWNAGNYVNELAPKSTLQNGKNYLHIHPMFLHSNATSHKWAFGAVAELLDNAVDEIQNGATFVIVDTAKNPRDGSPALLIQDDGGGMGPETMRQCMSFGFSDKKINSAIGKYGNGFKTSSMRLGADVIVFSRYLNNRTMTQSIGLLSYTFLTQTGHDRIVVPMIDYEFNISTSALEPLCAHGQEHFMSNLSVMLQWSPYSAEEELLKQFEDVGYHGTKVIIYNLWLNNDKDMELDFDTDPKDIRIAGDMKHFSKAISNEHIANRFRYSLRVYLSILYLRIPESFRIVLRGREVEHHNLANDLKFPEFILYRPHSGGTVEGKVVTTIGFLKEAPQVNIHGFNVYHKNRLILPFWPVVSYADSRGRGVVGVLEANFVQPTHNKQDFERTSLFQKLETRLKEMTWEYWDYHCGLIGYVPKKKPRQSVPLQDSSPCASLSSKTKPILLSNNGPPAFERGINMKRTSGIATQRDWKSQAGNATGCQSMDTEAVNLMEENKKLRSQCLRHELRQEQLNDKVTRLRSELTEVQRKYARLSAEAKLLGLVKKGGSVCI